MVHRLTLEYTEPVIRRAVFMFWRQTVGKGYPAMLAMLASVLASLVWSGNRSWIVGVLATVLAVATLAVPLAYVVNLRDALATVRAMNPRTWELTLDESSFSVSSSISSSSIGWSRIPEVRRFPDFWLLVLSPWQYMTLPLDQVSDEAQQFILDRISATGGKIVN